MTFYNSRYITYNGYDKYTKFKNVLYSFAENDFTYFIITNKFSENTPIFHRYTIRDKFSNLYYIRMI